MHRASPLAVLRLVSTLPALVACALGLLAAGGCFREQRQPREVPPVSQPGGISVSELQPGGGASPAAAGGSPVMPKSATSYEENAFALSEGKRLYQWFNCVGCHAHGGGGIGPPLMDSQWIYGSDPASIYTTILEGRPNGMPSFRGKIPDQQVWQLVAYVRSMSGFAPKAAAPGRDDHLSAAPPEQSTEKQRPVKVKPRGPGRQP